MVYVPAQHGDPDGVGGILFKVGAVTEETAVPLANLSRHERRCLKRQLDNGLIHEARRTGLYYVDAELLKERAARRTKFALIAIAFAVVFMIIVLLYGSH